MVVYSESLTISALTVWTSKQRADLFADIEKTFSKGPDAGHFMATTVCLRRGKQTLGADEFHIMEIVDGQQRLIIETKGEQFENSPDSRYKQKLLDMCSNMFTWESVTTVGELELVYDPKTTVTCALVYQDHWQADLTGIMRE